MLKPDFRAAANRAIESLAAEGTPRTAPVDFPPVSKSVCVPFVTAVETLIARIYSDMDVVLSIQTGNLDRL